MYHHTDPQECFEHAIFEGVFSESEAEDFMYMHSDATHDWFKHRLTRRYVKSPVIGSGNNGLA